MVDLEVVIKPRSKKNGGFERGTPHYMKRWVRMMFQRLFHTSLACYSHAAK